VYNIHYGKRYILGATTITPLAIDKGGVEQAADFINIKYSQETDKTHGGFSGRVDR
jgi:hypothetical protein